jgi:hypothetical protein
LKSISNEFVRNVDTRCFWDSSECIDDLPSSRSKIRSL